MSARCWGLWVAVGRATGGVRERWRRCNVTVRRGSGCAVPPPHRTVMPLHHCHCRRHLRDLLLDEERTDSLIREHNGLYVDFSRQNVTETTMQVGGRAGCSWLGLARGVMAGGWQAAGS